MVDLERLVRENIRKLKPYTSARDEFSGTARIILDANENSFGTPLAESAFHRYPDPYQQNLKQKISAWLDIPADQIFLGNGSDEAIDLILRVFGQPGRDGVLIMPPTYGMYQVSAQINDLQVVEVPLKPSFEMDRQAIRKAISEKIKVAFVCSPNNPTGNVFSREEIVWLLENFKGIVIVDEAYIDFAPQKSVLSLINDYNHLIVLRTFSKAWGSAGIRLGMAFTNPQIIGWLNKIKMPYNVSELTQQTALKLLDNVEEKEKRVQQILEQREWLKEALLQLPMVQKVFPSDANFLLVRFEDADATYRYLMERGIIVRNRSKQIHCQNCLRITVGTKEENRRLVEELRKWREV